MQKETTRELNGIPRWRLMVFHPARLAAVACMLAAVQAGADSVTLVRDGRPAAVIVLPPESDSRETDMVNRQAASELVRHIQLMSGAELGVLVTRTNGGFQPIRIDQAKPVDHDLKPVSDMGGRHPIRHGGRSPSKPARGTLALQTGSADGQPGGRASSRADR